MSEEKERFARLRPELEQVRQALAAFAASAEEKTSLELPRGGALDVEKVSGGVRMSGDGFSVRTIAPAEQRPADYPEDMPFVAGVTVLVQHVPPKGRGVMWLQPPDPAALLAEVERQLAETGWARAGDVAVPIPGAGLTLFRKGDLQRSLLAAGPMTGLLESRAEVASEGFEDR